MKATGKIQMNKGINVEKKGKSEHTTKSTGEFQMNKGVNDRKKGN